MAVNENQLVHEFFEKACAAKLVFPSSSAHRRRMKMAVLVEEGLRRLRNYSHRLDWDKSRLEIEKWSQKLRRSGYSATVQHEGIKAACEKWDRMCEDEDKGVKPIHRPREWRERKRTGYLFTIELLVKVFLFSYFHII